MIVFVVTPFEKQFTQEDGQALAEFACWYRKFWKKDDAQICFWSPAFCLPKIDHGVLFDPLAVLRDDTGRHVGDRDEHPRQEPRRADQHQVGT